ncbi:universal stress protein [Amycolatopsis mongoliensis]|uniref:Universal stress protein n=1 Tax=Amycolatopsis mongoliensis TaxID=715475 RepID=A0A9Y2JN33_9PSEU|nr:universal stress protein [Amycolatopsis sp. 4-36]WIY00486.1 universal stress protein [Amycolatopsis sp. 4-36]
MSHRDGTGPPRPIVAGVDGSVEAVAAARWAADEAGRRDLPLRLVHAVSQPVPAHSAAALPEAFSAALESDGREWLDEARAAVLAHRPGLAVELDLAAGSPVASLVEVSRAARLVVVGAVGLGGFPGILAGSTAVALVTQGHCPVAVVRGRSGSVSWPGPVVVGVDDSVSSDLAIAAGFEEAASRGADLVVVHAWLWFTSDSAYAHARRHIAALEDLELRERESLAERLDRGRQKHPGVAVRTVVARDRAVRCLLEYSADAQLLVVGSQGQGGFSGMVLGPVSQALLYHATCPLLVVRPVAADAS